MTRRQFLIAYDISDDKRRTGVFNTLKGQGDHVQFSVFLCALDPQELAALRGRLLALINTRADQIVIVDLGSCETAADFSIDCLGRRYTPTTRVQIF